MGEKPQNIKYRHISLGVLAHVDAGKTTLSEGLLFKCGRIRKIGRVDHKDAYLDTYELERERGITIFSKQAVFSMGDMEVTLLDTPGHVDFSAEMELTLHVLDYAILVINGADGVQGHTQTLWRLLTQYKIPTFLFVNKMDQEGTDRERLLEELKKKLSGCCVDFSGELECSGAEAAGKKENPVDNSGKSPSAEGMQLKDNASEAEKENISGTQGASDKINGTDDFLENIAMCEENLLESFLETGTIAKKDVAELILERKLFPCFFGSALKMEGVDAFIHGMETYMAATYYPAESGARIYKIARDDQGNRLTYMKITGGRLKVKETLTNAGKNGIPAEEIAFIHDAKTDAQRDALFKEMRTGKKKVLIGSTDKCGTGVNVQTHLVAMHHVDCPWKPSSIEQREGRGIRQGNENEEVAIYRYVTKGTFDAYNWSLVENKQRFISQVMTSKAVSRSCEDIDEATLSYAEIKAVATGNPLIKEKMEIDNDVQRLKLLKASYDNQRYGLQDNFMIKYPKLIKTATEKLANVREDVKARDKELIDNPEFAITIGKATYTERVDGGTMMLEAISKCKTGETTAIGKFHGFELLVEKNFLDINYMVLRGKTEYKAELSTSPVGSMVKLENLFNGLHENIDFLEKKIEQYQNDLEASKAEYDKPFAYSKELEEKLSRQCELNAQLDLENAKAVDADLSGPEEEREADDRMESAAIVAEDKGAYPADREGRTR